MVGTLTMTTDQATLDYLDRCAVFYKQVQGKLGSNRLVEDLILMVQRQKALLEKNEPPLTNSDWSAGYEVGRRNKADLILGAISQVLLHHDVLAQVSPDVAELVADLLKVEDE